MHSKFLIKARSCMFACVLLFCSQAFAQGTLGRVTAINIERGLIEIDGGVYSLTQNAINTGDSPGKTMRSFREGHIVRYSAEDQRIVNITLIDTLKDLPN